MLKLGFLLFLFIYQIQSESLSDFSSFNGEASSWRTLKDIVETLRESAKKGAKELKEKLYSKYIKEQLKQLSSFYRTMASNFLKRFQEILSKIENKIRPYSINELPTEIESSISSMMEEIGSDKRDKKERELFNQKYSDKFEILWRMVLAFRSLGYDYLQKFINSKEFIRISNNLDAEEREELMQLISDLNSKDETKDAQAYYSREYLDLRSKVLASHSKGNENLLKFIQSKGYSQVLEGLKSYEKQEIQDLVQQLTEVTHGIVAPLNYSSKFLELQSQLIQDHDNGTLDLKVLIRDLPDFMIDFDENEKAEIYNLIARLTIL